MINISKNDCQVPRIQLGSITYKNFFEMYIRKNVPCIIYDVTKDWIANAKWIDAQNNIPNFLYLQDSYGDMNVPIVDLNLDDSDLCTKKTVVFRDYLKYWKDFYENKTDLISYLKDWHLRKQRPEDMFYSVPEYFTSDWLNEYSTDKEIDDYMFVYMGPKGSWTPFHVDVFKSFSWSANVLGKKRWLLFPPGEEKKFTDSFGNLPSSIENYLNQDILFYEVIQHPGEAIFVPSGWHHQVYNIENTISVNHNWINSCNIEIVWNYLLDNLDSVENEIKEFSNTQGWTEHCQLMLQALFGMNICDFVNFVKHIAQKRIANFENISRKEYDLNTSHIISDLNTIEKNLKIVISEIQSRNLEEIVKLDDLSQMVEKISLLVA